MSVSPARWSASKNEPSGSRLTLRKWAKCTRGAELFRHRDDIVPRVRAERAGAKGHAVGVRRNGCKQLAKVVRGRHDAGQAEEREGRIVGMDRKAHAFLLGDGGDLAHEFDQIGAQALDRHVFIGRQHTPEAVPVIGEVARGQPVDQRPLKRLLLARAHRLEAFARRGDAVRRIVALGVSRPRMKRS